MSEQKPDMHDSRKASLIYLRLSRLMAMLPATAKTIAADLGVERKVVWGWARELRAHGLIGFGEVIAREGRVYVPGPSRPFPRHTSEKIPRGVDIFCTAWEALAARKTTDDLADVLGLHRRTATDLVRSMRLNGLVRVAGWEMRHQTLAPMYDRLPAPDVARPPPRSRVHTNADYWAKRRERLQAQRQEGAAA